MEHDRAGLTEAASARRQGVQVLAALEKTTTLLNRCEEGAALDRTLVERSAECIRRSHEALATIVPGPHSGLG
jgi:hypothetical protein